MRRREAPVRVWPQPPVELQRCVVEDLVPAVVVAAAGNPDDLLAAAFTRQRDLLLNWATEHGVPRSEVSRYRRRPTYRNARPTQRRRR